MKYAWYVVLAALLLVPAVLAAPQGATVSVGASERGPAATVGTATTEGGNVTNMNVSSDVITSRWAGFWGNISGSIILADASGNNFYRWTVTDVTGSVVYATSAPVVDWATLAAARESDMPAYVQGTAPDSYNNTFTGTETFTSASQSVANANFTFTYEGGAMGTNLKTYALKVDTSTLVFAAKAVAGTTGFNNQAVDYQLLVPAQGGTTTTYNFYLELP